MMGLTKRQSEALAFIRGFIAERGYSPSYAEIAAGLGYASKGYAHAIVQKLIQRGALTAGERQSRSFALPVAA